MPGENLTISEIIKLMPYKFQLRFNSLSQNVNGLIQEEMDGLDSAITLTQDDVQFIQLASFVYVVNKFLRAGTRTAREASRTFSIFGFSGFQVGSTYFSEHNENTQRGEVLANALWSSLADTSLPRYLSSSSNLKSLISIIIQEMSNDNMG